MALAKIIAQTELGIPWLANVDQMRASGALTITSGSSERGDLVGRDASARWHVVEAKGRSSPYPSSLVTKAKSQSARVTAINGHPPATTSACIASLFEQPISVLLDDPPPQGDPNGEQWRIEEDLFFKEYYRGIIGLLRDFGPYRERTVHGEALVVAPLYPFAWAYFPVPLPTPFDGRRLELGLLKSIYNTPERAPDAVKGLPGDAEDKVGGDGIAILGQLPEWGKD
jgi:hypothetical protein